MAERKNWDDISSDEDAQYIPKQKPQPSHQKKENPHVQKKSHDEDREEGKRPAREHRENNNNGGQKKIYPGKGDMINEIKKMENDQVAINIFKLEENVVAKDIYHTFKDVQIMKIFTEQNRPGSFTLDFENHEHAIHFIKVAPRAINGKNFIVRISNRQQKFDKSEWNTMGSGGRLVKPIPTNDRKGFKYNDRAPRTERPNYNRKEVENVYEGEAPKPLREQREQEQDQTEENQEEQTQPRKKKSFENKPYEKKQHNGNYNKDRQQNNNNNYKKPYNKNYNKDHNQRQESAGEYKPMGFNRGGDAKKVPEQQSNVDEDGFQTVGAKKEQQNNNQKQQQNKPKKSSQDGEDEWSQVGGNRKKFLNQN